MELTHLRLPAKVIMPNGQVFLPVLMRILSRDENNTPQDLCMIAPEIPVELMPGDEFFVSYVNESLVHK